MPRALPALRPKPRYIQVKRLSSGEVSYYFSVPSWARAARCPIETKALGTDRDAAFSYAETVLLPQFDAWRTGGAGERKAVVTEGRQGFVYFLVTGRSVKIGFSMNPFARAFAMKTGMSERIETMCATAGTKRDEARLHGLLKEHHVKGEWFHRTAEVEKVIALAATGRLAVRVGGE